MDAAELLARCDFPESGPLALAVSGGPDSTAMALLAADAGRPFTICHVDHGLRPESGDDADHVEKLAAALGVACEVRRVDVGAGPDLEARARAGLRALPLLTLIQFALGALTLVYMVPVALGTLHQVMAAILLMVAAGLLHDLYTLPTGSVEDPPDRATENLA